MILGGPDLTRQTPNEQPQTKTVDSRLGPAREEEQPLGANSQREDGAPVVHHGERNGAGSPDEPGRQLRAACEAGAEHPAAARPVS